MAEFLKGKEAFKNGQLVFQPLTKDATERFAIYCAGEKKFYNVGQDLTINGTTKKVEEWKFVKFTDEIKKFYTKNIKFNRNIIVDNKEVIFGFGKTANDALQSQMATLERVGKDPLKFQYVLVRKGEGLLTTYEVVVGNEVAPTISKSQPSEISLDLDDDFNLTDIEQKYVTGIKTKYPNFADIAEQKLVDALVKSASISSERAKIIVDKYLR
jgi:hypothetical protein